MMEELESKLGAILNNPQMMEQIMSFAQNLLPPSPAPQETASALPELDLGTIQKITSIIGKTGIDSHQQALLHALAPYLSRQRIAKLEKAMRAAKLANMASVFLGR